MMSRSRVDLAVLAGTVAVTRFLFRSHFLYDLDSVNFALAIQRFDPSVHQPHPPGYFLYICMGRLLNLLLHDANLSLVVLSILASCGAVGLIYCLALDWFGQSAARFAGLLFLFSPLAWFHGTVALTYSVEAFFSALLGFVCWRVESGKPRYVLPAAIVLGFAAGVRPSSLLFLGPMFLFSLRSVSARRAMTGMAVLLVALLAWFVPMIAASGGFHAYFGALFSLWRLVPSRGTVFNSSPATSVARACTILFIYFLGFGGAFVAPLARKYRSGSGDPRKKTFTTVWVAPALCFFIFIFLKFVNSGYLLLLSAPACIWLGYWLACWYRGAEWRRSWKLATVGACVAANIAIFLAAPLYCSYRSVRRFEGELQALKDALPQVGSPQDTLIVGFDSHFLGYRHAGYYLPGYVTVEYPQVKLNQGTRIFAMDRRETHLLTELPVGSRTQFVLFPLPHEGRDYAEYVRMVETKLPRNEIRTLHVGGDEFVLGRTSDLPLLFPAAIQARAGVNASHHSLSPAVNNRAHPPG